LNIRIKAYKNLMLLNYTAFFLFWQEDFAELFLKFNGFQKNFSFWGQLSPEFAKTYGLLFGNYSV